jgi:AcrR family transcriptional regulator
VPCRGVKQRTSRPAGTPGPGSWPGPGRPSRARARPRRWRTVSQGLPYRYFSDKDALIRALVTEAVQQADTESSPLAVPGSAAGRLRDLVTSMVEARRAQPELFLLFQHVVSDPATPPDLLELIQARGHAVADTMRQLITEAQAAGEVAPDDPDQLVTAIMACLDGLGRFTLSQPAEAAAHFPATKIITRMLEPPVP